MARTRAARAQLAEQQDRLQRELAEARAQAESESPELATAEQLGASLQEDAATLQQALEQLEKRLDNAPAGPLLAPAHKGKRVIWIGCKGCPDCSLFADFAMEKLVAADPEQALALLSGEGADGLITDISVTGIGWLSDVRKRWPDLIIVVTTGPAEARLAVDGSLSSIATTVISQPCEHGDIAVAIRCAFLSNVLSSGSAALEAERPPTRPRLLIAEDDEVTRRLISTCLAKRGYDTTCVADGVAALEAVEANAFDVLITDILMPRMDGIELTAKVKKLKPRFPVIILSAAGDVETSLKAMRAGAYGYVPKPADMDELASFIERAMLADRLERDLREQNALLDKRTNELDKALHELQGLQETISLIAARHRPQTECAGKST